MVLNESSATSTEASKQATHFHYHAFILSVISFIFSSASCDVVRSCPKRSFILTNVFFLHESCRCLLFAEWYMSCLEKSSGSRLTSLCMLHAWRAVKRFRPPLQNSTFRGSSPSCEIEDKVRFRRRLVTHYDITLYLRLTQL